jgi:hypothetical protein
MGFGVFGRSAYSSNFVGSKQYGRNGCFGLLMNLIVVFRFFMSASVDTSASHSAFSVLQTANTPSVNVLSSIFVRTLTTLE